MNKTLSPQQLQQALALFGLLTLTLLARMFTRPALAATPPDVAAAGDVLGSAEQPRDKTQSVPTARTGDDWPFAVDRGAYVYCSADHAVGFQAPAGMILALNAAGLDRARLLPHVWISPEKGLRPGHTLEDMHAFVKPILDAIEQEIASASR